MRRIEKQVTTYRIAFALKAIVYRARRQGMEPRPSIVGRVGKFLACIGDVTSIKVDPDFNIDELYEDANKLYRVFFKRDGSLKKSAFCSAEYDLSKIALSQMDVFPPIHIDNQDDPEFAKYFCRLLQYNYVVWGIAKKLPEEQFDYYKILYAEIYELLPMTENDWKDIDTMFPERTIEETLQVQLKKALDTEDYSLACQVRNKINELKE